MTLEEFYEAVAKDVVQTFNLHIYDDLAKYGNGVHCS